MKAFRNFLPLILIVLNLGAQGQNIPFEEEYFDNEAGLREATNNLRRGNNLYFQNKAALYPEALYYYLKANDFNSNNAELNYKIGVCYLMTSEKNKALDYLQMADMLDSAISSKLTFRLGMAYQYNLMWDEAIKSYKTFFHSLPEEEKNEWAPYVYKRIFECRNGRNLMYHSEEMAVKNVGPAINSNYDDYASLVGPDEKLMFFTSRRKSYAASGMDMIDYKYYEDIYQSERKGTQWQGAQLVYGPLNTPGHDAMIAGVLDTTREVFFYRSSNDGLGEIYSTRYRDGKWSKPKKLDEPINSKYMETSACLSPDGKMLYFVSDRPEANIGGRDIYYCRRTAQGWGTAINLGSTINSVFDEECVHLAPDGKTMYFSSKGHASMGGYDVFKSEQNEDGSWGEPVNMGFPLNSPNDELFFVPLGQHQNHGYFTSARVQGLGGKDIYMFHFPYAEPLASADSLTEREKMLRKQREISEEDMLAEEGLVDYVSPEALKGTLPETKEGITFKVQIAASHKALTDEQMKYMYTGQREIELERFGNFNRYVVGTFESYTEAEKHITGGYVPEQSFIVAYVNGDRQSLQEVATKVAIPTRAFDPEPDNPNVRYDELSKMIEAGEFSYKVQIAVSSRELGDDELEEIYGGDEDIEKELHKGLFKYVIGDTDEMQDAEEIKDECGVDGAFVVYYKDGRRYENVNNMFGVPGKTDIKRNQDQKYTYRLQLSVKSEPFSREEMKALYDGELELQQDYHNDLYKLTVGPFDKYGQALAYRSKLDQKDAFVVYYNEDGGRVSPGKMEEESRTLPQDKYTYKIQVEATKDPLTEEELKQYDPKGQKMVYEMDKGLYKYLVGEFDSYNQASEFKNDLGVDDAFIVVFKNGKRLY